MDDIISRQAAIDALKHNQDVYSHNFHDDPIDKYTTAIIAVDIDSLVKLPSAQPEKRTEERTETHACDLISRQEAIDAIKKRADKARDMVWSDHPFWEGLIVALDIVEQLPSAQPEPCKDAVSRQQAIEVADAVWSVTGDKNVARCGNK